MSNFAKKPVEVQAVQWTDSLESLDEIYKLHPEDSYRAFHYTKSGALFIRTLEGSLEAAVGDWIIRDLAGEVYLCKPEIFKETYTPSGRDKCKKYCKFGDMGSPRPCDAYEVCVFEWKEGF